MRAFVYIALTILIGLLAFAYALLSGGMSQDEARSAGAELFATDLRGGQPSAALQSDAACQTQRLDVPFNPHLIVTCRQLLESGFEALGRYTFFENDGALLDSTFEFTGPQETN